MRKLFLLGLLAAAPAMAGTTPLSNIYDFGSAPFDTSPIDTPTPPLSSTTTTAQTALTTPLIAHVHGYVSGGVSSRGGAYVGAGLIMPVVPGKLDLIVSGETGQTGTLPHPAGFQKINLREQDYAATLDYHPDPSWDLQIQVSQQQLKAH